MLVLILILLAAAGCSEQAVKESADASEASQAPSPTEALPTVTVEPIKYNHGHFGYRD